MTREHAQQTLDEMRSLIPAGLVSWLEQLPPVLQPNGSIAGILEKTQGQEDMPEEARAFLRRQKVLLDIKLSYHNVKLDQDSVFYHRALEEYGREVIPALDFLLEDGASVFDDLLISVMRDLAQQKTRLKGAARLDYEPCLKDLEKIGAQGEPEFREAILEVIEFVKIFQAGEK